ncbi:MAG: hypothetical protein CMF62_01785 [Magnetococcales bacterium]|nr:hypothetical protein [Magnetococcales bacterium]|tara:strand:+ start:84085 stop:84993 length:909 start_codon:yes stop_codon:yes gene_type:complete
MENRLNIKRIFKDELSDNTKILSENSNNIFSKSNILMSTNYNINNNTKQIQITRNGDIVKFLNISMDYNINVKIERIVFMSGGNNIWDIPFNFIKLFYPNNIIIKKNKLIIDMSFFYGLLCNFYYPLISIRYHECNFRIIGENLSDINISCEYIFLDHTERNKLAIMKEDLIINNINFIDGMLKDNKYYFEIKLIKFIKGFFIANINIQNLKKIVMNYNNTEIILCEDLPIFLFKSKKYNNGYFFPIAQETDKYIDLIDLEKNAILEIEMDFIYGKNIPEFYMVSYNFLHVDNGFNVPLYKY